MRLRDRLALGLSPLLLRLMLGVIFLWAGLGKVMDQAPVSGEDAAILASMGVIKVPKAVRPPEGSPPETPLPAPQPNPEGGGGAGLLLVQEPVPGAPRAADFPNPVPVRRVHHIALAIHKAAHPVPREDGTTPPALVPNWAGSGQNPNRLAWLATIAEIGGGAALLVGLLTRFASFAIMMVMLVAAWLTELGPAFQKGQAKLGFLPDYPAFDPAWHTLTLQFALFMAAAALLFSAPGAFSLDRAIFGRPRADDDDDE